MAWGDQIPWIFAEPKGTDDDPFWFFGEARWRIDTTAVAGWTGEISGVVNPAEVMGVGVANITEVKGVA